MSKFANKYNIGLFESDLLEWHDSISELFIF